MKERGGYIGIEYSNLELGIHADSIRLNTGRNCLEYLLLTGKYSKVYVPYYTCEAVLEPILRQRISHQFYRINHDFEPCEMPQLGEHEVFLYTNYFGLKGRFIKGLAQHYGHRLIVDNSQALFEAPLPGVDTFYSLRKFVGTSNGAFLYTARIMDTLLHSFDSSHYVVHLYKRKDRDARYGFEDYKRSEEALKGLPIFRMAASTEAFLKTYDFDKNRTKRQRNFLFLHQAFSKHNKLTFNDDSLYGPYCYPLLLNNGASLRQELILENIFVPLLWPNVLEWTDETFTENYLAKNIVPLPIDQRYELDDMEIIAAKVLDYLS